MQVLYRSLLTLILSHAHGDALPARVGAALEAELFKVSFHPDPRVAYHASIGATASLAGTHNMQAACTFAHGMACRVILTALLASSAYQKELKSAGLEMASGSFPALRPLLQRCSTQHTVLMASNATSHADSPEILSTSVQHTPRRGYTAHCARLGARGMCWATSSATCEA